MGVDDVLPEGRGIRCIGHQGEQPMMAMGSKGPWSVPPTSFPSAVIVMPSPHSMMVSGTIVIE